MTSEFNNKTIVEDTTDIRGLFNKILFHWPLYALMFLFSVAGATLYLRYKKPVYSSAAKIYIKDDKANNSASQLQEFPLFSGGKVVNNEMELIKSPIILEDVIRKNNFNVRYFEKGRLRTYELYDFLPIKVNVLSDSSKVGDYLFDVNVQRNNKIDIQFLDHRKNNKISTISVFWNQPFQIYKDSFSITDQANVKENFGYSYQIQIDSILPLAYRKSTEINASITNQGGSVFQLTYEDEVSKRTGDFLNAVLTTYNDYTLQDKNRLAVNTIKFINTRLASLESELSGVEKDVESFKRSRGITEIGQNSQLYIDQVKDADQRLNVANLQLDVYNQIERYINNPDNESLAPALGNVDQGLVGVVNNFQNLLSEKRRLSLSLQPNNQILQNLDQQINDTRQTIKSYVTNYRKSALTTKTTLERTVRQIEGKISEVPGYEREFINIKRQQGVKEGLYSYLLQKREESAVVSASNIIDNKIISPAYIPVSPIRPNRNIVIIAFVIAGFVLATIYIFLKYSLNKTVTDKQYLKNEINAPLLAEIFEQLNEKNGVSAVNNRSVLKEQMLNLRNNLKFLLNDITSTPVILFSSSISGEGKTFLSSHLANSLTYNNNKVILLELDLRKPKLSQSLNVNNSIGITNYLIGTVSLDDIIKKVPNSIDLDIIPSGAIPPNPVELLESERMASLFNYLKTRYNYIIVDTSPIGLVSDAKSLSPLVDCLLFVTRFNYTPKTKLKEVLEEVNAADFKKKGIIFNGVDVESSYGYSYGYSNYGYGYGNTPAKSNLLQSFFKGVRQRIF